MTQKNDEMLHSIAGKTEENEFYTPYPPKYQKGKAKFVFVIGTVMSGLGKGIFASSLAKLLQDKGLNVVPLKVEAYLNIDSGTLNPFRHGEVFVLDDGMETDMDLGTYERMLDKNLDKNNFTTSGQLFASILEKERRGEYLGRDIQIIPHVTGEIKNLWRTLAQKQNADIVFIEVGGTAGELENMHYIEAARQLAFEEGKRNVCFVALTYVITPRILVEQKSKAAQMGIRRLMELGIQPDIIACRADTEVTEKIRQKIAIYSNVPVSRVVSMHDLESIYLIPEYLRAQRLDSEVIDILGIGDKINVSQDERNRKAWNTYTHKIVNPQHQCVVGITGKYTTVRDSYASLIKALEHAGTHYSTRVTIQWIETTELTKSNVEEAVNGVNGIIVPGGFGRRGAEGKILCAKYARENNVPYLGLCFGFQIALVDCARHVCRLKDANSTELDAQTKHPVIDLLPEQKALESLGGSMRLGGKDVVLVRGTKAHTLYGKGVIRERFRHRYECNPDYIATFEKHGIVFSGKAPDQPIMQILELKNHPFFMATQFHPEFTSRPLTPAPLFCGFIEAILKKTTHKFSHNTEP